MHLSGFPYTWNFASNRSYVIKVQKPQRTHNNFTTQQNSHFQNLDGKIGIEILWVNRYYNVLIKYVVFLMEAHFNK